MTVDFYTNNSDVRTVDKDLTLVATIENVYFKDNVNKESLSLELSYRAQLMNCNYCYIRDFNYYYFVGEPTLSQQRIVLPINTDLLMTFKNDILNLDCIIARQEEKYNAYLKDDRYHVIAKQDITTIEFPSGFSDENFEIIIAMNGGGQV